MNDYDESQVVADNDTMDTTVEDEVVEQPKEDKRPSSVVKLLKQRNELKKQNEELSAKVSETQILAKKMAELEEMVAKQALDTEVKQEKNEFFAKNPVAKDYESEIDKLSIEKSLSYDEAFKLYAAINKPELLVDEQYRNKGKSSSLTWVARESTTNPDAPQSIKDFDTPEAFWERSENMARNSRKEEWYSN